jgi:hypothetical protein
MADLKISQLPASATPLAGTESLPIVQSSDTKKVAVSDLTAGRAVSAASYTPTGSSVPANGLYAPGANQVAIANNGLQTVLFNGANNVQIGSATGLAAKVFIYSDNSVGDAAANASLYVRQDGTNHIQTWVAAGGNLRGWMASDGTLVLDDGNILFGTAGKGIDFSANTHAAGMTSELLDWYEEGTWTPTDASGAGLTFAAASGNYTRMGNVVFLFGFIQYPVTASSDTATIGGLPFTASSSASATQGAVTYTQVATVRSIGVQPSNTTAVVYTLAGGVATNADMGNTALYFNATYFV